MVMAISVQHGVKNNGLINMVTKLWTILEEQPRLNILTEQNAWYKDYDWNIDNTQSRYIYRNDITQEKRPLTEEQYNDSNYILNTGE